MLSKIFICFLVTFTPETVPDEAGTYLVEYSQTENNKTIKTKAYVTIVDENTVINEIIAIDAENFTISEEDNISDDMVLLFSKAKAWNITTLEEYEIEKVDVWKVNDQLYQAKLYSFDNINTTIDIKVAEEAATTDTSVATSVIKNVESAHSQSYLLIKNIGLASLALIIILYILILLLGALYNTQVKRNISKLQNAITNVKST